VADDTLTVFTSCLGVVPVAVIQGCFVVRHSLISWTPACLSAREINRTRMQFSFQALMALPNPSELTTHGLAQLELVQECFANNARSHPHRFPSRIAGEPVGVSLSKSLKRRVPFANIAQASAFMSGSTEFVALSSSLPASCCPNLHHITPQRNT
jgi:hypothetical protein